MRNHKYCEVGTQAVASLQGKYTVVSATETFPCCILQTLSYGSYPIFRVAEVQIGIDMIAALIWLYALKVLTNLHHKAMHLP